MQTSTPEHREFSDFRHGIQQFGMPWSIDADCGHAAVVAKDSGCIADPTSRTAAYQALLLADALRYCTLQVCAAKSSGHPGGFASSAEAYAALVLLGHTNIVTEVGHHAPGFYSAMFLDRSLESMGIRNMQDFMERYRERHGLLGHLSGAIPGLLAPAGPLGQGQHFAMAGALLHPGVLFPVTIGDGGLGEPYVLSSMKHFHFAYPQVTNYLPILVWNGFSQEHHSMISRMSNAEMIAYWRAHDFDEVILVDAKDYDDAGQAGPYVDSTRFSEAGRMAFMQAVLTGMAKAAASALAGRHTAFLLKQLKGAGVHTTGAKAHNLHPQDTLESPEIRSALAQRALSPEAWALVRENCVRAGGGPAARTVVTERELELPALGEFPLHAYPLGETAVPATAMAALVAWLGTRDRHFVVSNADGTEASNMKAINEALKIRHPTPDPLYHQEPGGQVYEPLSEDACAGLAAGLALFGGRALWLSYESFAINGWPIVQTVGQAMAELRRRTPSLVCMFTAGALEQGRNGWTHQRPEIESYIAAQMRNGNVFLLYPPDANSIQVAYEMAVNSHNKIMTIIASKSPLPVRLSLADARRGLHEGAITLAEAGEGERGSIVFAVLGDMVLLPVFAVQDDLVAAGYRVRIVSVINPRQLYRPEDVAQEDIAELDRGFLDDAAFHALFDADLLVGFSGGPATALEPVLLRSRHRAREIFAWQRGDTTASAGQLLGLNGLAREQIRERLQKRLATLE
ncbi:phosphoketolase [Acidithiobacillus sp. AMEEHan]|uniref:phosphoketolase n=1 Tax=Acidithiobacillus sp. AMEEHan TaxID=2994951 RepID=UPI0027E5A8D9|nr:phosphoketolase [Acidithiobacillus sp. AMEEHan]